MKAINTIAMIVVLAVTTYNTSAKGLLGENYFGAAYDVGSIEDLDLWGVSFLYNQQLGADNEYAYDLHVSASYAELDEPGASLDGKEIQFGLVVYPNKTFELKPFIALSAGYGEATLFGDSDDSFLYQASIGGEWKPSNNFTITPYWSYFDYTSVENGDDSVLGIQGSLWLQDKYNVGIDFSRMSVEGFNLDVVSIIYRQSF